MLGLFTLNGSDFYSGFKDKSSALNNAVSRVRERELGFSVRLLRLSRPGQLLRLLKLETSA